MSGVISLEGMSLVELEELRTIWVVKLTYCSARADLEKQFDTVGRDFWASKSEKAQKMVDQLNLAIKKLTPVVNPIPDNEPNIDDRRYYDLRVYIISATARLDFRGMEREGNYQAIMDEAEENGLVYTLDEFVDEVNSGEMDNFSNSWILIR